MESRHGGKKRKVIKYSKIFALLDRSIVSPVENQTSAPETEKSNGIEIRFVEFLRSIVSNSKSRGARYYRIDTREAGERGIGRGKKRATLKKLRRETPDGIGAVWNIGKRRNVREIGEGGERRRHSASRPLFMTRT